MNKGERLKNSVLQMAMEGKLVPQNSKDQPAQVLVKKIFNKKTKMIKDNTVQDKTKPSIIYKNNSGKYIEKSGKKTNDISEEIPFEIPKSWQWVRLLSTADIYTGNSINKTEKETKYMGLQKGYNYIATKDVSFDNNIQYENGVKIPKGIAKFRKSYPGSILLCIEGGSAGRKIAFNEQKICFGNKLCCFQSFEINNRFLFYYLQSPLFTDVFKSNISGIIGGVGVSKIRKMFLPIPPSEEQKRIVGKIEEVLPLVEKYGKLVNKLEHIYINEFPEKIRKSILQEAIQGKLVPQNNNNDEPTTLLLKKIRKEKEKLIKQKLIKRNKNETIIYKENGNYYEKIGKEIKCINKEIPFDIPETWEWSRLDSIGDWKAGSTPLRNNLSYYQNGTIPWLKTGDLNDGIINEIPEKITELALKEASVRLNPVGSVLIAMYGATIGKVGILNIEATTNQACCACVLFGNIYNRYLFYYLMSQKEEFVKKGEGGAQPNISRTKIVNYLIPIPSINEQKRIVEKIEEVFLLIEEYGKLVDEL